MIAKNANADLFVVALHPRKNQEIERIVVWPLSVTTTEIFRKSYIEF